MLQVRFGRRRAGSNIAGHPGVIDGHNGMYSEPLMNFLIRCIGFTEAKKYLLAARRSGAMKTVGK